MVLMIFFAVQAVASTPVHLCHAARMSVLVKHGTEKNLRDEVYICCDFSEN